MSDQEVITNVRPEVWAVAELMGHGLTAGILRTSDIPNLVRIDVPAGDGFNSEYIGTGAIFRIKTTSEEIARAYASQQHDTYPNNEPIVSRQEYEQALRHSRTLVRQLENQVQQLNRRLTAVDALPAPEDEPTSEDRRSWAEDDPDDNYDDFDF